MKPQAGMVGQTATNPLQTLLGDLPNVSISSGGSSGSAQAQGADSGTIAIWIGSLVAAAALAFEVYQYAKEKPAANPTSEERRQAPPSAFAWPEQRKYFIDTPGRAHAALARLNQQYDLGGISAADYRHVYPSIMRAYRRFGLETHTPPRTALSNPCPCEVQDNPTAAERANAPLSAFAWPEQRKYFINTPGRARNALVRLNQQFDKGNVTPAEYRHVYPSIMRAYHRFGFETHTPPRVSMHAARRAA